MPKARRKVLGEEPLVVLEMEQVIVNRRATTQPVATIQEWFGNVDTIDGWQITTLPEGQRDEAWIEIVSTDTPLTPARNSGGEVVQAGHLVLWQGAYYEIQTRNDFTSKGILEHVEYRAMRVRKPPV